MTGTIDDVRFAIAIDGKLESISVERVQGREALSELFVYEISVASTPERAIAFAKDLGRDVALEISQEGSVVRRMRGIIVEVLADGGALVDQRRRTTLVVMPKLSELQRVRTSRTFKRSDDPAGVNTAKEIVLQLLKEAGVEGDWQVNRTLDKYMLRMQFEETNYDFMRRLLAFEGIHFHFAHAADQTTVVFTNAALEDKARPALTFREGSGGVTGEDVRNLRRGERIRVDAVRMTDFDFHKPGLKMTASAPTRPTGRRVVDEHPGHYALPEQVGAGRTQRRLEELNDAADRFFGESNSARLAAGHRFSIAGHADAGFNGEMVATHILFTATARSAASGAVAPVTVELRAVRDTVALRPANLPWPLPPIQTARVVGPRQDEPHTADPGMVKVRFYWDVFDADTSVSEEARCAFVRVGTDMAGPGFGTVMWPRAGMEVVVDFLNGKLDEPIVVRSLYNEVNKPPYDLPDQETRSGFKSSTVGGIGHNEWFFEDKAGQELVFLHAQRDRRTKVNASDNETVGASQSVTVGANQALSAGANQAFTAGANQAMTAGANQAVTAAADQAVTSGGNQTVVVGAGKGGGDQKVTVHGDQTVKVTKNRDVNTTDTDSLTANAVRIWSFGGGVEIEGNSHVSASAGGNLNSVDILGTGHVTAVAQTDIQLAVGDNTIKIDKSSIALQAKSTVTITVGDSVITVTKDSIDIKASSKVKLTGAASSLLLDAGGATLKGSIIKLNCP